VWCWVPLALAEEITATVGPSQIAVTYNYEGAFVYVFGRIEGPKRNSLYYDLVITVRGPSQQVSTWRKERIAGLWINKPSRMFDAVPSTLGVYSNRPLDTIASEAVLRKERLGIENLVLAGQGVDESDHDLTHLIALRKESGLYSEQTNNITFLTPAVFRADIPLPAHAMIGSYAVDLVLFANGKVVARNALDFSMVKVGIEDFIVKAAKEYGFAYGLAVMFAALGTGLLASIAFRRS
jgi:uncharacterized protein (TIGR02186 family)